MKNDHEATAATSSPDGEKLDELIQSTEDLYDWIKAANFAFDAGKLDEARDYYQRALETFNDEDGDRPAQILCLSRLGSISLDGKKNEDALQYYERSVKLAQTLSDEAYCQALLDLARCFHALKMVEEAQDACMQAMSVRAKSPDATAEGKSSGEKTLATLAEIFPPASKAERLEERQKALSRKAARRWNATQENLIIYVSIFAAFLLSVLSVNFPNAKDTVSLKATKPAVGEEFKTVDGLKNVKLVDDTMLYFWDRGKLTKAHYETPDFTLSDILRILPGFSNRKNLFFTIGDDYIVDEDGSVLYKPGAPETLIADRMWRYAGFAKWHYGQYHYYPTNSEQWASTSKDFWYTNPFTKQADYAIFASGTRTDGGAPVGRPGAIHCLVLPDNMLSICGYDRAGKRITNSAPGKNFAIEMKQEVNNTENYLKGFGNLGAKPEVSNEPVAVYLVDNSRLKILIESLDTFLPSLVLPMWFASLAISLCLIKLFQKRDGRLLALAAMILPTALLVLVLIMSLEG